MLLKELEPITIKCKVCGRGYIKSTPDIFNPLGYMQGLCSDCMSEILFRILEKGYPVFKNEYINKLFLR
jgi:hypothetical protein